MVPAQRSNSSPQPYGLQRAFNIKDAALAPLVQRSCQGIRLLLVRHCETDWNCQKRFQGWIDVPLNQTGRQQAQQVAEFLKQVPIDLAFSSSMSRSKETAEIILSHHSHVPLELRDDLKEISHGIWEGKLESEVKLMYPTEFQEWQAAPATVQKPKGENLQQVWERATSCWQSIVTSAVAPTTRSKNVLVVAHDGINKIILCHVCGLGAEYFWNFQQGNGAVSIIDYPQGSEGLAILQALNISIQHLAASSVA
jgi:probable phosphoglycerate mutase